MKGSHVSGAPMSRFTKWLTKKMLRNFNTYIFWIIYSFISYYWTNRLERFQIHPAWNGRIIVSGCLLITRVYALDFSRLGRCADGKFEHKVVTALKFKFTVCLQVTVVSEGSKVRLKTIYPNHECFSKGKPKSEWQNIRKLIRQGAGLYIGTLIPCKLKIPKYSPTPTLPTLCLRFLLFFQLSWPCECRRSYRVIYAIR